MKIQAFERCYTTDAAGGVAAVVRSSTIGPLNISLSRLNEKCHGKKRNKMV